MIDKMIRCKDLLIHNHIESLNEWFVKCPPQGKEKHWKEGRSAKETAKHWVYTIPQPFKDILKHWKLEFNVCSPEFVSTFDANGGNGRNHDLLILAENENKEPVVISVESKADEPFGNTISDTIKAANERLKKNPNSKGLIRIKDLRSALFGKEDDSQLSLMYQLLAAVAGTIAEAKKQKAKSAIFLIQTFISYEINSIKHKNQDDLDSFITLFSKSNHTQIHNNQLIGPFRITSKTNHLPDDIDLWIGKYEIEI
jgi:hypothetical protein